MDQTLKDLKIIAKVQQNGRIRTSNRGDIELEAESALSALTRTLSKDSRNKAFRDIQRVMRQAFEHADGILKSKYMNIYDLVSRPSDADIDQHQEECRKLRYLGNELTKSILGLKNLMNTTYKDDASFGADIEIVIRDIKAKVLQINSRLDRLRKKGTLPNHFPRPVVIRRQTASAAPAIIESDQIEVGSNTNPLEDESNYNNSYNEDEDEDNDEEDEDSINNMFDQEY